MAKYLISFPSTAMVVPEGELEAVGRDAHAVIEAAKDAGVHVFAGGIDEDVPPVLVSADGAVAKGGYAWAPPLDGGFTVLEGCRAGRAHREGLLLRPGVAFLWVPQAVWRVPRRCIGRPRLSDAR
jgi:hypothetical protein